MPAITSIFLFLSLVLAVVIGPQTRSWTWGAAMLPLGISLLTALPVLWKRDKSHADLGIPVFGFLVAAWFAWRACTSPVAEFGQADLMLLCATVGAFICIRTIAQHEVAERILTWGIAILLLANLVVMAKQIANPEFTPLFRSRPDNPMVSGFFAHYNDAANYLIASSMLLGAAALSGHHRIATRLLWIGLAAAGIAGTWFTHSRGGILGAAVACGVFATLLPIYGKRRNAKWFAPTVIAIPLIGIAIVTFLLMGWQQAQDLRLKGSGLDSLLDNNCRLYFYGIALSCIGLHPLSGGGSRSYSWECFRFVEGKANGDIIASKPELVHNELLQSATDYGLMGAGLLICLLSALALMALLQILFEPAPKDRNHHDAWKIGALAALAGMLVQSCFSFVFHLIPGVLLLGVCLGRLSLPSTRSSGARTLTNRILLTVAAISGIIVLLPYGWKSLRLTRILWPTYLSKSADDSPESKIDALTSAIELWPQHAFYQDRAIALHELAGSSDQPGFRESAERAISDYQLASQFHPYDPTPEINRANLLSQLQRDTEAEATYAHAILLQGGMEPAFRGHFSLAKHLLNKGLRLMDPANPKPAHQALSQAAKEIESAVAAMHWITADMHEPRAAIHEYLGIACELTGDRTSALAAYDFTITLPEGRRAHYRASVLISRIADEQWHQRKPSEALTNFLEARRRIDQSGGVLPADTTPSQRTEFVAYLDQAIQFLKGAKIQPLK